MDEQATRHELDGDTLRVFGGGWCRVEEDHVTLLADDGEIARTVDLTDVVSVRRGGPDLTLVRRDADPVSFTMTLVEHARQIEDAVEARIASDEEDVRTGPSRSRWRFWQRD